MMWYGSLYFITIFTIIFIMNFIYFKFFFFNKSNKKTFFIKITLFFLSSILFFFLIGMILIYNFFFLFETFAYYNFNFLFYFDNFVQLNNLNYLNTNFNLVYIYYFPFIYIFLIITVLAILFCLSYNYNEIISFTFYCLLILLAGYALFLTDSIIIFFFSYELLLVPSFFILYKFAKTRRCIEAAYLMFFWTQFGALFLIFSFIYIFTITNNTTFSSLYYFQFSEYETNFIFFCWLVGFGVKLPIWPFYGWLPKAHVEASTNFSIFLSGVLVKFAFLGFFKCLITLHLEPTFFFVFPFLLIGITDAVFKLFYQIDLKKLVAYSTVVEMHWLTICVISGQSCLILSSFCMLISHALLSSNSFLLVDAINRRYKTRLITEISGLNFATPKLFLLALFNCLIFLGFPGSIFFIAEFLFFSFLLDIYPLFTIFLIILLYFLGPTFYFRSWLNVMFGLTTTIFKKIPLDLTGKELILYLSINVLMFWLGFSWQLFLF